MSSAAKLPFQRVRGDGDLGAAIDWASENLAIIVTSNTGKKLIHEAGRTVGNLHLQVPAGEPDYQLLNTVALDSDSRSVSIVAIGGGSTIDYAKLIAAKSQFPEKFSQLQTGKRRNLSISSRNLGIDIVAVPTTIGSGSEVSSSAVFLFEQTKASLAGPALVPAFFIHDSNLIDSSPLMSGHGLLDIVGHSLESLFSRHESNYLDLYAGQALTTVVRLSSREYWTETERLELQQASARASYCQDMRLPSLPHALSHHFPLAPHGLMVGWFLDSFLTNLKIAMPFAYDFLGKKLSRFEISVERVRDLVSLLLSQADISPLSQLSFVLNPEEFAEVMEGPLMRLTIIKPDFTTMEAFSFRGLKLVG